MIIYICNAFSLSMLDRDHQEKFFKQRVPLPIADPVSAIKDLEDNEIEIVSAIGHDDTARVFSKILGFEVAANRISVKLKTNEVAIIGQYIGPRLPEGATQLPEGATIEWWIV